MSGEISTNPACDFLEFTDKAKIAADEVLSILQNENPELARAIRLQAASMSSLATAYIAATCCRVAGESELCERYRAIFRDILARTLDAADSMDRWLGHE